jgi:uncharacterized protein (TIGR02246 family)
MKIRFACSLAALTVTGLLGVVLWSSAWADSVRDAINASEQRWAKLYNAKDAPGLAMTYTRDALRLAPDASRVQGRAAIQAMLQKELDDGMNNIKLEPTDIGYEGNMAWVVGNFSINVPTQQGGTTTATGNYVGVYVKDPDGVWRLMIDTWNDMPPK